MELKEDMVSIIVPVYKIEGNDRLNIFIKSLNKYDAGFPYELIVEEKKGRLGNINYAMKHKAKSRYICVFDDDIEIIQDNWLKDMMSVFEKYDDVGMVGAKTLMSDGKTIDHAGVILEESNIEAEMKNNIKKCVVLGYKEPNSKKYSGIYPVWQVAGAVMLFDRLVAGYFPEKLYKGIGFYGDIDYQGTIHINGYKIYINADVEFIHHQNYDLKTKQIIYSGDEVVNVNNHRNYIRRWSCY